MMKHIRELIELEYATNIDGKKVILLEDEEGVDEAISRIENAGKLFIRSDIFISPADYQLLSERDVVVIEIPEYYFKSELEETGQLW